MCPFTQSYQHGAEPSKNDKAIPQATVSSAIVAVVNYFLGVGALLWLIAFLIPKTHLPDFLSFVQTLDSAPSVSVGGGVAWDIFLILLFGISHSLFARPAVKKLLAMPPQFERSFFMFQTSVFLCLLLFFWRNFDAPVVWNATTTDGMEWLAYTLTGLYMVSVLFLFTASFALDHFRLFGLTQGIGLELNEMVGLETDVDNNKDKEVSDTGSSAVMKVRWHYAIVAHPIMTGMLGMVWITAKMTMPHLLLSISFSCYIFIAVKHFEEPDLRAEFGSAYEQYLKTVPRFIPFSNLW